jgi:hypothetical protein
MANKKITDYTEVLAAGVDDFLDISVDLGGGVYDTRKIKASNIGGASPLTTKGDLFTYDTADARLPIGTDGQALIADSAEATGLRWGTVSADNMATADLTLTGDRTHDLNGYTWALGNISLSSQGDFSWSGTGSGNNFVLNTSSSKVLRITGGHPSAFLELYSTSAGTSAAQFYSMTFYGNKGTRTNLKLNEQGHTFVYNNLSIGINKRNNNFISRK